MASLQKHRSHESLNMDSAADWQQQGVNTVGALAESLDVSNYHTVHIMTDYDLYFEFTDSSTDALTPADVFYLMGGDTIYSLKIPRALGNTIYLWMERKEGTNCAVRMVLS